MNVKDKGERDAWVIRDPEARAGFRLVFDYIDQLEAERDALRAGTVALQQRVSNAKEREEFYADWRATRDRAVAEAVREACEFVAEPQRIRDSIRAIDLAAVVKWVK